MNPEDQHSPDKTLGYEAAADGALPAAANEQRYSLSNLHAAGGIGEIWLARDLELDRDVAVKKLHSQRIPSEMTQVRFLREARITGQLDHPGVVPVYEICRDPVTGLPYYTMRFLRGRTLTEEVRNYHHHQRPLKVLFGLLNAFDIICNTVAYAHSKGIIHRDLKCENVILGDYGEVVVIDWGLAKQHDRSDVVTDPVDLRSVQPAETVAGQILGTPAYMAPEQAAGDSDAVGPSADVYGLSAILYEILCGRPPFAGTSTIEVLEQVKCASPAPPSELVPGVPPALEQICLKGLQKSPSDRHASAEQLGQAVRTWVSELAELRRSEAERERFFALSQDLLAIVDADGRLGQLSPAWRDSLGYNRDHLLGAPFVELMLDADRAGAAEALRTAHSEQQAVDFVTRTLRVDQTTRWVSWHITPMARERALYAVGRDITELKKSQLLFEGVLQSAPDALVLVNAAGRITLANRQTENIFGYSQHELIDQPIEILIPRRFRESHPEKVQRFFSSSSFRPMGSGLALCGLRKDGQEFPAEISLSAIELESTKLVAASIRDLSDRRRA